MEFFFCLDNDFNYAWVAFQFDHILLFAVFCVNLTFAKDLKERKKIYCRFYAYDTK